MEISEIIQKLNQLSTKVRKATKSIFEVGGKGYYENPTSDLLAFFCNPDEEHGLGEVVLDALLKCLPEKDRPMLSSLAANPIRELPTSKGRIDLIFEGDDWVLTIENKIYHTLNNDLDEYEKYIRSSYSNKKLIFAVLAPIDYTGKVPSPWIAITYKKLIDKLWIELKKERLSLSKWTVFLDEFISNLEHIVKGENEMSKISEKQQQYIEANIFEAFKAATTLEEYFSVIKPQKIAEQLKNFMGISEINCVLRKNWKDGTAYYCTSQNNKHIWFYIVYNHNNNVYVQYYIKRSNAIDDKKLAEHMLIDGFYVETEGTTWYKYIPENKDRYKSIDELKDVLAELSIKYNDLLLTTGFSR